MSPILDLQRRMTELGRIRTGDQVEFHDQAGKTKSRPRKLETFRLTSGRRDLIEEAARLYGGEVRAWGEQWEVVITADTLPVMLPPGEAVSQWNELWSGGGCSRRCDGRTEMLSDQPCMCPADPAERRDLAAHGQACKPTTRVNLILAELPALGLFRLESHGYYAAVELAGAAEYLSMATSVGHRIPAHLRIVKRSVKRQVNGKPQTRNFTVPTIDIDVRPLDLLTGSAGIAPAPALPSGPVNRRERVERPGLPSGAVLPEEADFERPRRPSLPPPPELEESEAFTPAAAEPVRPTDAPRAPRTSRAPIHTASGGRAAATRAAAPAAAQEPEIVDGEFSALSDFDDLPGFEAPAGAMVTKDEFGHLLRVASVRRGWSPPERIQRLTKKALELFPNKVSAEYTPADWGRLAIALDLPVPPLTQEA